MVLGILREENSFAAKLLTERGLNVSKCRTELERTGPSQASAELPVTQLNRKILCNSLLPLSSDGLHVLALALEEAEALGQRYIGVEHLLLGVIRRERSFSAKLLAERGVDAALIRKQLKREVEGAGGDSPGGAAE
jgi:ATP-dependent Clp protease ATP-binding subunit ClpC